MSDKNIYLGIMSGTSLDGIDLVAVRFNPLPQLISASSFSLPGPIKQQILQLCSSGSDEIEKMGHLDIALGDLFAQSCNAFIKDQQHLFDKADIAAIGSHGQTIRHRPHNQPLHSFTLQIGDANTIAEKTSLTTIADFRKRDMAAGGQGAPLVPAFHKSIFYSPQCNRVILNIGGMANVSLISADQNAPLIGFDTGPGNVLMDAWINKHRQLAYDADGAWASSGSVDKKLLESFLTLDYFSQPIPKSTGREQFNLAWIEHTLAKTTPSIPDADVQATLLELTAISICNEIRRQNFADSEIFICGGGAHNQQLNSRITALLPESLCVKSTRTLGLDPDWVEATAFAWLAQRTLAGMSGNCPTVTGASGERILGAIYQG